MGFRKIGLTVIAFLCFSLSVYADGIFASSYNASTTFADAIAATTMTVAFDGTHYWSTSGGSNSGVRLAEYDASGTLVATYSPGLDFRSVFTDASGNVYARQFADGTIYQMVSPGNFVPLVTLSGGSLDAQASIVLNSAGTEYVENNYGTVNEWNLNGTFAGTVTLSGFGSMGCESCYPQGRGIASAGGYFLSYSDGTLSAWDASGNRVGTTTLNGAGSSFDSNFSLSYANGEVFINDFAGGSWRGYDVGLGGNVTPSPEPSSLIMLGGGLVGLAGMLRRKASR